MFGMVALTDEINSLIVVDPASGTDHYRGEENTLVIYYSISKY